MSNTLHKKDVITVISYARFYGKYLSIADCINLHQWAQRNNTPDCFLKQKFNEISALIKSEKWELPEYQYNSQLRLMYRTSSMDQFKSVPNSEY